MRMSLSPKSYFVPAKQQLKYLTKKMYIIFSLRLCLTRALNHLGELKEFLGNEYQNFNLVVPMANGRPCEKRIVEKEFLKLKEKANLPNVVFHSLRHSSTTYKLKLNHGDLKATQGDTGHAQLQMITEVYTHILDEELNSLSNHLNLLIH